MGYGSPTATKENTLYKCDILVAHIFRQLLILHHSFTWLSDSGDLAFKRMLLSHILDE